MPSEMDKSYELIGRVFEKLVGAGLRKTVCSPEDFGLEEGDLFFNDVMNFLTDEHLVRIGGWALDGSCFQVQLTSAGLAAIEGARFGDGQTVRSTIEEKKGELSSATYGKIGSLIGGMIGGLTKAIGGKGYKKPSLRLLSNSQTSGRCYDNTDTGAVRPCLTPAPPPPTAS